MTASQVTRVEAASRPMAQVRVSQVSARGNRALGGATLLGLVFAIAVNGCVSAEGHAPPVGGIGPGSSTPSTSSVACTQDTDCNQGEACTYGVCQMRRCANAASYTSVPPLGQSGYAMLDRQLVVSAATPQLQIFTGQNSTLAVDGKMPSGINLANLATDVAGGNLTGKRPESLAYVTSASSTLLVVAPDGTTTSINVGWPATRVATGDTNGDGIDEILVAGNAQYAVCSAVQGTCTPGALAGTPDDIAIGDVDGDGNGDLLFIGNHVLTVVTGGAGTQTVTNVNVPQTLGYLSAGDLDGDGIAEIIGKEAGSLGGSDHLYVFDLSAGALAERAELDVAAGSLDLVYTRLVDAARIAVITDPGTLQVYSYASGQIAPERQTALASNGNNQESSLFRLAAADVDGNSPTVRFKAGPTLQPGPAVPLSVLTLPPYSASHSAGTSSASIGDTQDMSTSTSMGTSSSTSVSLTLGVAIGFPSSFVPLGPSLSVYLTGHLAWSASHSTQTTGGVSIGESFSLTADPQVDGYNSAGVVLGCGCFHQYDYEVDDPAGMLGLGASQTMSLYMPVGGQTLFLSARRYNALVDALGSGPLPPINVGYKLGDVASYAKAPVTLDGDPIAPGDNVFPSAPVLRTSDVGTVSFSLSSSESMTNTTASSFSYGATIAVGAGLSLAFGIVNLSAQASLDATQTLDQSYSVTVGSATTFSGNVPPIRDDPSTSTNESQLYGYSFQPIVYRHHFTDATGKPGAFYVLTYSTGS